MTPSPLENNEIQEASLSDSEIKQTTQTLETNQLHLLPFPKHFSELLIFNGILLHGDRIFVLKILQTKVIRLAHEDHAGVKKTKQRLGSKV